MNKRVIEIVQQWGDFIDKTERHAGVCAGGSSASDSTGKSTVRPDPVAGKAETLRKITITKAERVSFRMLQSLPLEARAILSAFVSSGPDKCRKSLRALAREAGFVSVDDYKIARGRAEEALIEKDQYWNPSLYFDVKKRKDREIIDLA